MGYPQIIVIVTTLVGLLGRYISPKIGKTKSEGFLFGCLITITIFFIIVVNQMVFIDR